MSSIKRASRISIGLILILFLFTSFSFNNESLNKKLNEIDENEMTPEKRNSIENDILNEIFTCSDEQLMVNRSILLQTISFMIQETDELDPKLIQFVRSLIHVPSKNEKINLKQKNKKDFSQIGQSLIIDKELNSRRNGFFIEAGGYEGEVFSVNYLNLNFI